MAGLNVGAGNMGSFRGMPEMRFNRPKPQEQTNQQAGYDVGRWNSLPQSEQQKYQAGGGAPGINAAPSQPPPRWSKFGGMLANQDILPSTMDPYRKYGTVSGGRMTPPTNQYAQNQPIRFTPGGEYGSPGPSANFTPPPIKGPGPGMPPGFDPSNMETPGGGGNPWLERGGFTGGQMPPGIGSGTSGLIRQMHGPMGPSPQFGYYNPQTTIPDMQQGNPMANRGFRGAYGGAGATLPNRPFRNNLFY